MFFLFLLFPIFGFSKQNYYDTLTVYFEFASHNLSYFAKKDLHQFFSQMDTEAIKSINISAYTDTIGTVQNNIRLAQRRAHSVSDFLLQNHLVYPLSKSVGEDTSGIVPDLMRRVTIVVEYKHPSEYVNLSENFQYHNKDTSYHTQEGNILTIGNNAFGNEQEEISIVFKDYTQKGRMIIGNMHTSADSFLLESASMFHISTVSKKGGMHFLEKPIKYIPANKNKLPNIKLFRERLYDDGSFRDWIIDQLKPEDSLDVDVSNTEMVFTVAEKMPVLPKAFQINRLIGENLQYPPNAVRAGIEGNVIVSLLVTKTGEVQKIKVIKSLAPDCDSAAIAAIKKLPAFMPAENKGKTVDCYITIPVRFALSTNIDTSSVRKNFKEILKDSLQTKTTISNNKRYNFDINNDIQNAVFPLNNLGYINCDRFINSKMTTLKVKIDTFVNTILNCKAVLKEYNSISNSAKLDKASRTIYLSLPDNSDIILLTTFRKKGYFYLNLQNINTKEGKVNIHNFEKLTTKQYIDKIMTIK